MRAEEKKEAIKRIQERILKHGIPMDAKTWDDNLAAYIGKMLEEELQEDEPLGTVQGTDFDHCPRCNGIIGQSAFYCKRCGAMIREGGA